MQSDVASTLVGIEQRLRERKWKAPSELLETLQTREQEKEASNAKKASEKLLEGKLNPLDLLTRFDKASFDAI